MFSGFMAINGVEVINAARVEHYIREWLPGLEVRCGSGHLREALGHGVYSHPARDGAPWYNPNRPASGRFFGLIPGEFQGIDDGTSGVEVTQLTGDGAVHSMPRYGSLEIRVKATLLAKDWEAMEEGWTWLKDILGTSGGGTGLGCVGRDVRVIKALSVGRPTDIPDMFRTYYQAEVIEGPLKRADRVAKRSKTVMREVEWVIDAGSPFAFTDPVTVGSLLLETGLSFVDPEGEDCAAVADPYSTYVSDPFFTAIQKPPAPPVITPPNLVTVSSWRRLSLDLPTSSTERWGRVVPIVRIATGATGAQQIRLRFYEEGMAGCDFDGEFLISYVPPNAVMTLDAIRRQATVTVNGVTVPAGHLLFGSNGTPFTWPSMRGQRSYVMRADMMPGQTGITVTLETAVRE